MPDFSKRTRASSILVSATLGFSAAGIHGCEDSPDLIGQVAEQCGLSCSTKGFIGGDAKISNVAFIDAFFGAAIDLNASMRGLSSGIRVELDAIAASVGVARGSSGTEIKAGIEAYLAGRVQGGLRLRYAPPRCRANIEASISAAAECDAEVDPGNVTVNCQGSCSVEAGVAVDCGAEAELECTGTAPDLVCEGACSGSCVTELAAETACEGTCRGSCTAGGSTMDGFEGQCDGMCMGECAVQASAGVMCDGKCEGSCTYKPPSGMCDTNAEAHCDAKAGGSVECSGGCEGTAEPPSVSAECEASVEAKADASIECSPPSLDIGFEFSAELEGDLEAQAEFRAWLAGFRGHFSALLALRAKADVVADAAVGLSAATDGAVSDAIEDLSGSANVAAAFGAVCAVEELPVAAQALAEASESLARETSASLEVISAFDG